MTVLDDIVAGVREDLSARQATTSLDELTGYWRALADGWGA